MVNAARRVGMMSGGAFLLLASPALPGEYSPPTGPAASSSLVSSAVLTLGETRWSFSKAERGGVRVHWSSGDETGEFVLADGILSGEVVGVAATGRLFGPQEQVLAIGVAVRGGSGATSYAVAFAAGPRAASRLSSAWRTSGALRTAEAGRAYHTLSVAMPEGDTLLLALQRLVRDSGGEYRVESIAFVHDHMQSVGRFDEEVRHGGGELLTQGVPERGSPAAEQGS